ncbi:GM15046 [Drosophila sechellia]|uniref:GM15046 n=1 Tax=Drosophila sechellia TaxID=7238 RepID=B4IQ32_DROSE|nr:GM15046 [Drosophila sechellia]
MVADDIDDGVAIAVADQSSSSVGVKEELPAGNYILVGVDIDTTGRRLMDEIVQLAAYTPTDHFEQYIMPYMNLNPAARQRHQVRVISIGFYRMLKSMQTYKVSPVQSSPFNSRSQVLKHPQFHIQYPLRSLNPSLRSLPSRTSSTGLSN